MRAPEPLHGTRVISAPAALDALTWPDGGVALRLAPDDLLVLGAEWAGLGDAAAIVEDETGFAGWWLTLDELRDVVLEHIDWPLPAVRPALAQGLIGGVPARLWLAADRALLLCAAAHAHELEERLA